MFDSIEMTTVRSYEMAVMLAEFNWENWKFKEGKQVV
jgi:hypothetical protein